MRTAEELVVGLRFEQVLLAQRDCLDEVCPQGLELSGARADQVGAHVAQRAEPLALAGELLQLVLMRAHRVLDALCAACTSTRDNRNRNQDKWCSTDRLQ